MIGNHEVKADFDLTMAHPRNRLSDWFSARILEVREVFENLIISDENKETDVLESPEVDDPMKTIELRNNNEDE